MWYDYYYHQSCDQNQKLSKAATLGRRDARLQGDPKAYELDRMEGRQPGVASGFLAPVRSGS